MICSDKSEKKIELMLIGLPIFKPDLFSDALMYQVSIVFGDSCSIDKIDHSNFAKKVEIKQECFGIKRVYGKGLYDSNGSFGFDYKFSHFFHLLNENDENNVVIVCHDGSVLIVNCQTRQLAIKQKVCYSNFINRMNINLIVNILYMKQVLQESDYFHKRHPCTIKHNDHIHVIYQDYQLYWDLRMIMKNFGGFRLLPWKIERIVWIAYLKNQEKDKDNKSVCYFALLPKDVVLLVLSFLK